MEWAYVAGYFDGEGNVRCKAAPSRPDYVLTGLSWSNTHRESLEMIQEFIGCGNMQKKKKSNKYRSGYQLNVQRRDDVLRVGKAMLPYLIVKREQMEKMLAFIEGNRSAAPETWGAITDVGVEEVSRLYHEEGMTQREIAKLIRVSDGAVSTFFLRNGINGRRTGPREGNGVVAKYGVDKLVAMYESGMTLHEIAKSLDVRYGTLHHYLWRKGVKLDATKAIRRARKERKES